MVIHCHENSLPGIKLHLENAIKFLSAYSWLVDAYIIEYFTENHWEKIPLSWQHCFEDMEVVDLSNFVSKSVKFQKVLPLSFMAFLKSIELFSIERIRDPINQNLSSYFRNCSVNTACDIIPSSTNKSNDDIELTCNENEFLECGNQHKFLCPSFRRHVKPKKQHEIFQLSQVITNLSRNLDIESVVDVGAGQGHLSRLLSYEHNMGVITIDSEDCFTNHAAKFDDQAMTFLNKKCNLDDKPKVLTPPIHVTKTLTNDFSSEMFSELVESKFSQLHHDGQIDSHKYGIVGLHTCGNLAPKIIQLFSELEKCSLLVSLSCCYMKMYSHNKCLGYPLSQFVKNTNHILSYEALEVACHALEMFIGKLTKEYGKLKIHCYRATLELLITKKFKDKRRLGLRSVKYSENLAFKQYSLKALSRTNFQLPDDYFDSELTTRCLSQWKKVIIFYFLRLMIAPVIESTVLLDRLIFLQENGISGILTPIFDPSLSPRNIALIALKRS